MENVIEIINQLERTSSTNDKIAILKEQSENETLKKVLYYTYSDNLQYGFSEKKLRELLKVSDYDSHISLWNGLFEMLDVLSTSNINDELRNRTVKHLLLLKEDERELVIRILTKDLRCNISSKTINKAIKGLIKTWDVQQAYPVEKVKLKKNEWICLPLKLNGIRSSFFNGEFKSRQNKIMCGYEHIKEDLIKAGLENFFVDGELVRKNIDNVSDNENFRLTTSVVNSDAKEKPEIEFVIFDLVPKDEFIAGESKLTFKHRLIQLFDLHKKIEKLGLKNIRIMPVYYTGTDHSMIDKVLQEVDAEGLEGIMCIRDMKYKTKRHNGILKCKTFKTCDIKIIGFEEGDGKLKGTLGSIVADYKGNKLNIGSGYKDEEREFIWKNRDSLLGRIVEVKYKDESKDKKTGLLSVQFPTFVCIREEDKEVSYN